MGQRRTPDREAGSQAVAAVRSRRERAALACPEIDARTTRMRMRIFRGASQADAGHGDRPRAPPHPPHPGRCPPRPTHSRLPDQGPRLGRGACVGACVGGLDRPLPLRRLCLPLLADCEGGEDRDVCRDRCEAGHGDTDSTNQAEHDMRHAISMGQ